MNIYSMDQDYENPISRAGSLMRALGDSLSLSAIGMSLMGMIPEISALAALVWTLIRIYETKTVQNILRRRRKKKNVRLQDK